jgi:SNF2 family DNA or RNA helicase
MKGNVDACLINPPFSLQLEQKNIRLDNCSWGKLGPRSSVESHIAALEIAITKAELVVGAIVPTSFFTNESTYSFEKWVNTKSHMRKVLRIDLPAEAFQEYGTSWECSIVVYTSRWYGYKDDFHHFTPKKMEDLNDVISQWMETATYLHIKDCVISRSESHNSPYYRPYGEEFEFIEQTETSIQTITKPTLPLEFKNTIRVCINANGSGLRYKPSDLLTGLMLQSCIKDSGKLYGTHQLDEKLHWNWDLRLSTIITETHNRRPSQYIDNLQNKGIKVEIDPAVQNWLEKQKRKYEINITPFENWQFDEDLNDWVLLHEDNGIRTTYPHLYSQQAKKLEALGIDWLWDYQKDDVIRMSMKKSNLYTAEMGLGKTRTIIALGMLYGCKHNLIIVEPKLTNEFLKEFKKVGITDVQVIESKEDVLNLKKFNIISYRKIWSPLTKDTTKSYAKVLKKRCNFVALDEAHKISGKNTKQGQTAREIGNKAKHVLLCTGTPINNYPRNIYPLLVCGWGDGTQLNEYGYIHPIKSGYQLTPGTRAFADTFIKIEWVTEQFAQTLDTGAKAREIPVIKDLGVWRNIIDFKMIRRRKTEPEVKKYMPDLNPQFYEHFIMPDINHLGFYKHWLENFASWFREQLKLQKIDSSHNISTAIILAHLGKLDFASTIPQSPKMNKEKKGIDWTYNLTKKQEKVIELVKKAVKNEEKVIVYSGRPDFQEYILRQLKKEGITGHTFTGRQSTKDRVLILEDFKSNPEISVLCSTTKCGDTGLNIPEASTVIFADVNWTPSKTKQAYSRILRPDQEKEPHIHMIYNKGMIDEYMKQLCDMKNEGINQAIDGHNAEEFDPETWMSYKDFSYKMLTELGMI